MMLWFFLSLLSALSKSGERFAHRNVMMKGDSFAYSFVYSMIGALLFLPLALYDFHVPVSFEAWLLVIFGTVMFTLLTIISFESYKHSELSVREPITSIRLIIVFLMAVVFLSEKITTGKIIGTLIITAAIAAMTFENGRLPGLRDKGVLLTIISSIMLGIVSVVEKMSLNYFTPIEFGFLMFLLPGLATVLFLKGKKSDVKALASKNNLKFVLLAGVLCSIGYGARLWAYSITDLSLAYPVVSLSTILTPVLGVWLLHERKNIRKKAIGVALAFAGTIVISLL
ncbi:DMT family transporter [Candidatus Micrarchaeota archaeon]|nr:DMT family transporter [Candidatus Micrarchaeota archaeon]